MGFEGDISYAADMDGVAILEYIYKYMKFNLKTPNTEVFELKQNSLLFHWTEIREIKKKKERIKKEKRKLNPF